MICSLLRQVRSQDMEHTLRPKAWTQAISRLAALAEEALEAFELLENTEISSWSAGLASLRTTCEAWLSRELAFDCSRYEMMSSSDTGLLKPEPFTIDSIIIFRKLVQFSVT